MKNIEDPYATFTLSLSFRMSQWAWVRPNLGIFARGRPVHTGFELFMVAKLTEIVLKTNVCFGTKFERESTAILMKISTTSN